MEAANSQVFSLKFILESNGIMHRLSCPHTPQQGGVVECKALLAHSLLPQKYWVEAFNTSIFLINRLPTQILQNLSPFEKLFNNPLDYSIFLVFCCACYPFLRPYNQHKLEYRTKKCFIFLGYSLNHRGYGCLDMSTGQSVYFPTCCA